jgi:hypothetical protein
MAGFEKGSSLRSSFTAIRAELGEAEWQRVLDVLDPGDREIVMQPDTHNLVPTAVTGRFYSAIHRVACGGDRLCTERKLRAAGRRDADDMLDGVFSVFARFVSPDQAFKRAGGMISSIYSGVTAESIPNPDGHGGALKLIGLDDEPFASCVIAGWIERAIERFGARNASVIEREWAAGRDAAQTLVFDLKWE